MRPSPAHLLAALTLALGIAVTMTGVADAHRAGESYLYLDVGDDDLRGKVHLPFTDLREVLGLRLAGPAEEVRTDIEGNLELIQRYTSERTSIGADSSDWRLVFGGYDVLTEGDVADGGLGFVVLPFTVELPGDTVPQVLEIGFTPFLDEIPDRNNLALVANDWRRGVIGAEANTLVILDAGNRSAVVDLGGSSQWKNFDASVSLGVDHIRTGPDHILFIFALLLPSVLVLSGTSWRPAPRFRTALWRILIVATMFTLAHSITFTLAGMNVLPLPPEKFTETLIAVSIAVAALHNLRPVLGHREWAIAFVFGLFHGMGFAGLVDDLEITRMTQLVSLLGRNLGIEIGQAVIVLITFPALYLLSRTRAYKPLFTLATLGLAAISTVWVFERVLEEDYGINAWIDKTVKWPRSFAVCVVATALVAAFYWWERRNERLVMIGEPSTDHAPLAPGGEPVGVGS